MSQVTKKFITNNAVDGTKIRLDNAQALRARNAADSADVNILTLDSSDIVQVVGALNASGAVTGSNLSGSNTGDVTLTTVGASPNGNGASLSGQALTLQPFDASNPGVVSASGGGTTNFLRADGTWVDPTGGFANDTLSNLASPTAINQDLIFDKASTAVIKTKDTGASNSESLHVYTGATSAGGNSGDIEVISGASSAFSGAITLGSGSADSGSGFVSIQTGGSTTSNTGSISISTGTPSAVDQNSGDIEAITGDVTGTAGSGGITISTGAAVDGGSGAVAISTGTVTGTGDSSDINITTGNSSANTGALVLTTGNGDVSGSITLEVGTATTTRGKVTIKALETVIFGNTSVAQSMKFNNAANTAYVGMKAPNTGLTTHTYTLPTTAGTSGYILSTNGTGTLSWIAPAGGSATNKKELITLSGTDITNQYVDLTQVARTDSVDFLVKGGGIMIEGASYDYSISYTGGAGGKTRISFLNDLATAGVSALVAGDVVVVKYEY